MGRRRKEEGEQSPAPEVEGQQGATPAPQQQNGGRSPPAAEFRIGRVKVVIWANQSADNGTWYSIVPGRTYKIEATGEYKTAGSFGRDDCLAIAECFRQALLWINQQLGGGWRKQQSPSPNDNGREVPVATAVTEEIPF